MNTAFQISEDDITTILRRESLRVADTQGRSFDDMASDLFEEIDHDRIEKAALNSGTELDDQTDGAHAEIKVILAEMGVLKI